MFIIVGIMLFGIGVGFLLRNRKTGFIQHIITALIWLLLFILGFEVGNNPSIMNSLHTLGVEALIITIGAVLGSALFALLLWRFVSKKTKEVEA